MERLAQDEHPDQIRDDGHGIRIRADQRHRGRAKQRIDERELVDRAGLSRARRLPGRLRALQLAATITRMAGNDDPQHSHSPTIPATTAGAAGRDSTLSGTASSYGSRERPGLLRCPQTVTSSSTGSGAARGCGLGPLQGVHRQPSDPSSAEGATAVLTRLGQAADHSAASSRASAMARETAATEGSRSMRALMPAPS